MSAPRIRVVAAGADPSYRDRPIARLRIEILPRRGPALPGVGALVHGFEGDDGRSWSLSRC